MRVSIVVFYKRNPVILPIDTTYASPPPERMVVVNTTAPISPAAVPTGVAGGDIQLASTEQSYLNLKPNQWIMLSQAPQTLLPFYANGSTTASTTTTANTTYWYRWYKVVAAGAVQQNTTGRPGVVSQRHTFGTRLESQLHNLRVDRRRRRGGLRKRNRVRTDRLPLVAKLNKLTRSAARDTYFTAEPRRSGLGLTVSPRLKAKIFHRRVRERTQRRTEREALAMMPGNSIRRTEFSFSAYSASSAVQNLNFVLK